MRNKKQYLTPQLKFNKFRWTNGIEKFILNKIEGYTLHLCSGRSKIGNVRIDLFLWDSYRKSFGKANMLADANKIPFKDNSWDTVVLDPIYDKVEPPFLDESIRVLKNGGLLIYYYPSIPCHPALNLIDTYIYPNKGSHYFRVLSLFRMSKLVFIGC